MSEIRSQAVPRSIDAIRGMAATVRDAVGYRDTAKIDACHLVEFALPHILPSFVYDIKTVAKMGENEGLALPDKDYIAIREDVYEGARRGRGRDMFTVAHELGHLILHQSENLVLRKGLGAPAIFCQPEWQADTFAAEFLMDHRMITAADTPHTIARRFGVSMSCAQKRIRILTRTLGLRNENEPRR